MKKNYFLICCALFVFGLVYNTKAQVEIIQTVAGGASAGSTGDNGPASSALLSANYMMALDAAGNLYIADNGNAKVRKIAAGTGIITTVAGSAATGYSGDGGPATNAKLGSNFSGAGVVGVAVDASNNIYIADGSNNVIRKVNAVTGNISTIIGTGTAGYSPDGTAALSCAISAPRGVAVDAAGNVYFADAGNFRIRFLSAALGSVYTIAGTGTSGFSGDGTAAVTANISSPRGVYVNNATGDVYFADFTNNCIRKITAATGNISTVAGVGGSASTFAGDGGPATAAAVRFSGPTDVKLDVAGNMFIPDNGNQRVRYVNTAGNLSTIAGGGTSGFAGDGNIATNAAVQMRNPVSVAIMPNSNYFYIGDRTNNRIRLVKPNSTPYFNGGSHRTLTVCENSAATSINAMLSIIDTDYSQTETWSQVAYGTSHGTVTLAGTSTSNGGVVTPAGKTYQPNAGYSGTDSFIVKISDGFNSSNDTVIVTVNPLPVVAAVTGLTSVCELASITLSDVTPAGVWTASNTNASVVGGTVTGAVAGTVVISYTVTNACGPTSSTSTVTVNPLPVAGTIGGASNICMGSVQTLNDVGGGAGVWSSGTTAVATANAATGDVGGVTTGSSTITYAVTNGCGTARALYPVTVITLPVTGTISGFSSVCVAASITLTDPVPGGTWSESTGNAMVVGGTVTGSIAGADVISYNVSNLCGMTTTTYPITINPLPNAGSISGPAAVCTAGTITLTDAAIGGLWSASNSNALVVGGTVTGVVVGTDIITYAVTNVCGTANATQTINIISLPTAGAISGPTNVCVGAAITLTDGTSGGVWSMTNTRASVVSGTVTGAVSGLDTAIYTVSYSCGVATATYQVSVNPLADAGSISGSGNVCIGSTTTFTDAMPSGVWSAQNTNANVTSAGVVSGVAAGADVISYSVTNGCGTISATMGIIVNPIVTPAVTITATPGFTTCQGNPVNYLANPVNGGPTPSYQWSVNGAPMATGGTFTYTPANNDVLSCVLTTSAICASVPAVTNTVTATVKPFLTPAVSISTGAYGDTVCVSTLTPFSPVPVNGGTTPSYDWMVNGVLTASGLTFNYAPNNGDVISCVLTSSYLCPMPATAASNSITMTVDLTENPAVGITANPGAQVCSGSPATFSAHPLYGGVPPSYRWTKNGVNVATGINYTCVPHNGDRIYCMMISSSTCITPGLPDTVLSSSITMNTVAPVIPAVTITASPSGVAAVGENVIFTAVVTPVTATTTYQWFVNGTSIPGANAPVYILNSSTDGNNLVNCIVGSGDACNETTASNLLSVNFTTGINTIENNGIMLIPNPNNGVFTIEGTIAGGNNEATVEIMNLTGQVIYRSVANTQNGTLHHTVSLNNDLANGVYLLHIVAGNDSKVIRFTVGK